VPQVKRTPQHQDPRTLDVLAALQLAGWKSIGKSPPSRRSWRRNLIKRSKEILPALGIDPDSVQGKAAVRGKASARRRVATKYEDPGLQDLIHAAADVFEAVAAADGDAIPFRPVFGTLPSGKVNAQAILVPEAAEFIIAFDAGLFTFAHVCSKIVVEALPRDKGDGIRGGVDEVGFSFDLDEIEARLVTKGPELRDRFFDLAAAYVTTGDIREAEPFGVESSSHTMVAALREACEYFILGHEYGHILAGHLCADSVALRALPDHEASEALMAMEQEHEADEQGFVLAFNSLVGEGCPPPVALAGPELFFGCTEQLRRICSVLATGSEEERQLRAYTHPPPHLRRRRIHDFIRANVSAKPGVLAFPGAIRFVLEWIWMASKDFWVHMHKKGKRPAAIW
jgi:hypothetical protein